MGIEGTEKFEYAGEMLVGAAGSSPGLYYIGARWMDPALGRWYSLDPELGSLSMPQTMNRYVYCANNPLRFTDPTEMGFWDDAKKWWDKHGATVMPKSILIEIRKRVSGSRRAHGPAAARSPILEDIMLRGRRIREGETKGMLAAELAGEMRKDWLSWLW